MLSFQPCTILGFFVLFCFSVENPLTLLILYVKCYNVQNKISEKQRGLVFTSFPSLLLDSLISLQKYLRSETKPRWIFFLACIHLVNHLFLSVLTQEGDMRKWKVLARSPRGLGRVAFKIIILYSLPCSSAACINVNAECASDVY